MRRSAPPSSRCVANAWRRRCGGGRGAGGSRCRAVVHGPRRRARSRRRGRAGVVPRAGSARRDARPPRRAGRRGPSPPCRAHVHELLLEVDVAEVEADRLGAAQARPSTTSSTSALFRTRERSVAVERRRRSRRSRPCFGASGSRRGRRGARGPHRASVRPEREAEQRADRASLRAIVAGCELAAAAGRVRAR